MADDVGQVTSTFDLAMRYCPHQDIAIDYFEYLTQKYEDDSIPEETVREALDKIISHCGSDIYDSQSIWKSYREFEIDEHADSDAAGEASEVKLALRHS